MFESHPYIARVLVNEHLAEPYATVRRSAARRAAKRARRAHEEHPPAA